MAMNICARGLRILCATTFLTPLILPTAAYAQTAGTESPQAGEDGLGVIVVTATRSSENIQNVPISMLALGEAKLEERQVKGVADFVNLLPSVMAAGFGPGRQEVYFRGIVPAGGGYDATGYYLDDMPITTTGAGITNGLPDVHIYDVERVEALAGPQGTLYGAGSLAGTVRIITNKPVLGKFEFGYDLETNKYGKGDFGGVAQAYMNLPVSDTFAIRAMGYYQRDGGYIDNKPGELTYKLGDDNPLTSYTINNDAVAGDDYNKLYSYGGRISALWEVVPGWELLPQITAQEQIAYGSFNFDASKEIFDDHQNAGGDLIVHDYGETRQLDRWYQAALSIHGHIGDFDLVSSTGYYQRRIKLLNDYTYYTVAYDQASGYESYLQFFDQSGDLINPTQYSAGDTHHNKFNQEIRLTTPKDWPFDITVGGFYQSEKFQYNDDYATPGLDKISGYTAGGAYSEGGNTTSLDGFGVPESQGGTMVELPAALKREAFYLYEGDVKRYDKAIFAEGHWEFVPSLTLTAGIRYFWTKSTSLAWNGIASKARNSDPETSTAWFFPTGSFGCPVPFPDERLACVSSNPLSDDKVNRYKEDGETHKVALNWQIDPSKMVYMNYSTGFRPGGSNSPVSVRGTAIPAPAFTSETLTNYEFGFKTTWSNMFRLNAAVYYQTWKDVQYGVQVVGAAGGGFTGNAGDARVYGFEYDADLRLGPVTISTAGAYTDAALDGDFCAYDASTGSFVQSCDTAGVAAKSGTRLPRQPKFKGNTSVRYSTDLGDLGAFVQGVAYYQTGATQNLDEGDAALLGDTKGFASFDLSFGISRDSWKAEFFIQNIFDKRGILTRNTFCQIQVCEHSARSYPIKPQFFGIRFGQKF